MATYTTQADFLYLPGDFPPVRSSKHLHTDKNTLGLKQVEKGKKRMKIKKKCALCGVMFTTNKLNKKTCSPECSKALRRKNHDLWIVEHPEYMRNYFIENRERYSRTARRERKALKESMK